MELQTDPKKVKKLSAEHDDENWRFRSFLKGIDLESGELDVIVQKNYEDVSSRIDCCACGNCCREVFPLLHASDIERLASGLEFTKTQMTERLLSKGEDKGTFIFKQMPCPLLSDSLCTAYKFRPDDCRSFPHLHKEEFVFRLIQTVENCSICPIVYNVFERLKDELWHEPDEVWEEDLDWDDIKA